jgi:diguanylate cyclase (GGDEF)-like protein
MARIMVVEDEPDLRLILKRQLEKEGYEVFTAEDGLRALELLATESIDLALLDIMMPRMDGLEVMRRMRENYRTAVIPVILLTARSDHHDKLLGLTEGATDYLTKPYEHDELAARVKNTLELSRRQRSASPLTGLPGNQTIQEETLRTITRRAPFASLYIDLDNFKSYNDYYGYQRGDEVICRTSAILCDTLDEMCAGKGFVGHVGGDDFVVLTTVEAGLPLARTVVARFDAMIPALYDEADRRRGHLEVANRQGEVETFPIVSMTVAVALDEGGRYEHVGSLGAVISELKRFGKLQPGSVVVPDRRSPALEEDTDGQGTSSSQDDSGPIVGPHPTDH